MERAGFGWIPERNVDTRVDHAMEQRAGWHSMGFLWAGGFQGDTFNPLAWLACVHVLKTRAEGSGTIPAMGAAGLSILYMDMGFVPSLSTTQMLSPRLLRDGACPNLPLFMWAMCWFSACLHHTCTRVNQTESRDHAA